MLIRNVVHGGLKRLIEADDARGVQPAVASKLRRMVAFLQDIEKESELHSVPTWKPHLMKGNRAGIWSLYVTRNWRLTFRVVAGEIVDLDYEDYHKE